MDEHFIPRKERHRKHFFKRQSYQDQENIQSFNYVKAFILYFLLFSMFELVHIYLDQHLLQQSLKILTNKEIYRCILAGLIYLGSYLCVVDTYFRFDFPSIALRIIIPVLAFVLSFISMLTMLIPHL
ncbi:hypothetical protein V7056_17925 [Bacillus sp. JJ664]